MTTTVATHDRAPIELPHRTRIEILIAVLLGIFLAALDQTIVGTALPRIVTDLNGNDLYTWAFTGYLLTATISGPIYGKLSDIYGRRPIFIIGVSIFLVGSMLCGLSGEMWQFIGFRALQGLGAGALFPVALSIIGDIFSPSERGKYQGFFGAVFGLSFLLGPAIGGLITDTVGWHWVFYVNVPIGAVVLFVIWRTLPTHHEPDADRHIDYLGGAVFVAALVPILIGFTNKQSGDWTNPEVGGLIALGALFAAAFVWVESRAKEPILPLELFRIRAFTASVTAFFLSAMGFFAAVVFLPRWYQVVAETSATESGYQILPLLFGLIISAIGAGQLVARTGRYKSVIIFSLLTTAVGLFLLTNLRTDTSRELIWLWMAVTGLGIGPAFAVFTLVVQNAVPVRELGIGHLQPHLLPAGGRHGGPGDRRVAVQRGLHRRAAGPAGLGGRAPAVRGRLRIRRDGNPEPGRRRGRPGRNDPCRSASGPTGTGRAAHPGHRCGHPQRLLAGHRIHLRDRHRHLPDRGLRGTGADASRPNGRI